MDARRRKILQRLQKLRALEASPNANEAAAARRAADGMVAKHKIDEPRELQALVALERAEASPTPAKAAAERAPAPTPRTGRDRPPVEPPMPPSPMPRRRGPPDPFDPAFREWLASQGVTIVGARGSPIGNPFAMPPGFYWRRG